jgi:hypothetical protein
MSLKSRLIEASKWLAEEVGDTEGPQFLEGDVSFDQLLAHVLGLLNEAAEALPDVGRPPAGQPLARHD